MRNPARFGLLGAALLLALVSAGPGRAEGMIVNINNKPAD
jgi:hypothetical protein